MPKIVGAAIAKSAKDLSVVRQFLDDGSYEDIPYDTDLVKKERTRRIEVQKTLFDLSLDIGFNEKAPPPDVLEATQLRAIESDFSDQFDGVYSSFRLLQPPVDPKALVHITQRLSIFEPIIDSMKNNVVGFGHTFHERMDFDSDEVKETLREHFEGMLVQEMETDGIRRLKKFHAKSSRVEINKDSTPWNQALDEVIIMAYPALKHRPLADAQERATAIRLFKSEVSEYVRENTVDLLKIRRRTFDQRMKEIRKEKKDELHFLENFFEFCNPRISWMQCRKRMVDDYERIGAWSMEIARDIRKRLPVQLGHLPVADVRMTKLSDPVMVRIPCRINKFEIAEVERPIRFRKFCQSIGRTGRYIWFKEFGDPRIMDSRTGRYVGTYQWDEDSNSYVRLFYDKDGNPTVPDETFMAANRGFAEANEILYYARYNAMGSPYPVPRWFGSITLAQGLIAMEEVNALWFDNDTIPPMMVKVTDGEVNKRSEKRLQQMFEGRRGREKKNSVMIVECESNARAMRFANTGKPTIEIERLRDIIQNDATHTNYDEKGRLKIRAIWRLPPAHIGQESQYTRQSISASKVAAEEQVFQPERADGDDVMNYTLMLALQINHWLYRTNSPPVADNLQMAQVLSILGKAGFLTVGEARPEVAMILNRPLKDFGEKNLVDTPFPLVLIQEKVNAAMAAKRGEPDNQLQKPEDKMGARPDKEGMASASEVVKSTLCNRITIGETVAATMDDADQILKAHIKKSGGAFVFDGDELYFSTTDRDGNILNFVKKAEEEIVDG